MTTDTMDRGAAIPYGADVPRCPLDYDFAARGDDDYPTQAASRRDAGEWAAGWWILPLGLFGLIVECLVVVLCWHVIRAVFAPLF